MSIYQHTFHRTLFDMGPQQMTHLRAFTDPALQMQHHCHLRLQWAREHRDWTMEQWKKVAWLNET